MMKLEKAKIYGVDQVGRQNPLNLPRTDDAEGLTVTVGESEIHSDFDCYYPWSDMDEIVDSHGNVFVKIPKFYSKVTKNEDGTYKYQISGVRYSGFDTLFIDGKGNELPYVLVGKYEGSGSSEQVFSKSGETVLVSTSLETYRSACRANGKGYQQLDGLIYEILKHLWLSEMATTHCQSVMRGYASGNSAALTTGHTDVVATPSGSEVSNTDGQHAMKYRGIENLWGNLFKHIDGVNYIDGKFYVSYNPEDYAGTKTTGSYTYQWEYPTDVTAFITKTEPTNKNPLLSYTSETSGGSSNTYYCDIYSSSTGNIMSVGGSYTHDTSCGLWYTAIWWYYYSTPSNACCRLCFKPIDGVAVA